MQEMPEITNTGAAAASDAPGAEMERQEPGVEQRLREAELNAQEHHDAWLRARAEADNIRKRSQTEIANAHKFAVENFATELLAVKDSLEAALASDNATVESLRSGVELTLRQLKSVFEKFNVKEVDPTGERFDPHRDQHGGLRAGAEHGGAGVAEGLSPARPRDPAGARDRRQTQSR
jgi:molecular chaperone GrpE